MGGLGGQCPGAPELKGAPREKKEKKKKKRKEKKKEKRKRKEIKKRTKERSFSNLPRQGPHRYIPRSIVVDRKFDPTESPIPKSEIGNQHTIFEI